MLVTSRKLLPSISALSAFDAVARLRSFSLAAQELSLTQGAISRQISTLEDQLGTRLFNRDSRSVALTEVGETYALSIANALEIIRSASLEAMTGLHGNTLDLAILPTFGTRWLMPRISGFVRRHPGIILNFATRIGIFDLAREGMDAAIHVGQADWPGADCHFLMNETVVAVCSRDFLERNPVHDASDLLALPLFHMASRPGAWEHWFSSLGLDGPAQQGMGFEQFSNATQACIAGIGVGLMPLFLIQPELESGQLVKAYEHEIKSQSAYYLVSPIAKRAHAPLRAFTEWLVSEAGSRDFPD